MTVTDAAAARADRAAPQAGARHARPPRAARRKTYLMCPPDHFAVEYAINPWMSTDDPVDQPLARRQWQALRDAYLALGHEVRLIDAVPGLPDMVFAANGATVVDGTVLGARFRHPERAAEGPAYLEWFRASGYTDVREAKAVNEGEGDIFLADGLLLAAHGFRTDPGARAELRAAFRLPVVSLRLVDPRYYHLDTALCVLAEGVAACYPPAFDDASRAVIASLFDEVIEAKDEDAEALGLNAVSDGRHVVLPAQAEGLAGQLAAAGFEPVPVDFSQFRKAGGGPKCCTLELRPRRGDRS